MNRKRSWRNARGSTIGLIGVVVAIVLLGPTGIGRAVITPPPGGGCSPTDVAVSITSVDVSIIPGHTDLGWSESPAGSSTTLYWGTTTSYGSSLSVSDSGVGMLDTQYNLEPGTTYDFKIVAQPPAPTCQYIYTAGTYTGTWAEPWFSAIQGGWGGIVAQTTSLVGANVVNSAPYVSVPSGVTSFDGYSIAGGWGSAYQAAEMYYTGWTAAFTSSIEVTVTWYWWAEFISEAWGAPPGGGNANSSAWIRAESNIQILTPQGVGGWVYQGNVVDTLANDQFNDGVPQFTESEGGYYDTTVSLCFAADTFYTLYGYLYTGTYAQGYVADYAEALVDLTEAQLTLGVSTGGAC